VTVWIDSDSCPAAVRDMAARRISELALSGRDLRAVFVSNRTLPGKESEGITHIVVPSGKDRADDYILASARIGDMVLTKDFLLAEKTVEREILTMNFDGNVFERKWLKKRIEERNLMEVLYNSGSITRYRKKSRSEEKNREFDFSFSREIDKILFKGE
jgi:uncharacterized protein